MTAHKIPNHLISVLKCNQGAVRAVNFNGDGNYCVTCGGNKSIKLWNPDRELLLKTYTGHGTDVLSADCSCDNSQICSGGVDKAVIVWDVSTGKVLRKYRVHAGQVNCVQFNEDSTLVLSASVDGTVKVWDTKSRNFEPIQNMNEATDSVTSLHVSDHEILTGSADYRVRRYDVRKGEMSVDYVGSSVSCVNFTRDGQCILVGSMDRKVRLLDKETGELLNTFTGHMNQSYRLDSCLSNGDTNVLSGSEDGHVYCWDLISAKVTHTLNHDTSATVHSLAYHPTEDKLLTASGEHIYMWKFLNT